MEHSQALTRPFTPGPTSVEWHEYYRRLGRVKDFVSSHLSEDLSLTQVAKVANLSPKYFSTYFRQHTGACFREWLAEVRVERAKKLLAQQNHSVVRVALMVGFKDVRTFQRAFKKVTGMTARTYKKTVAPG